MTFSRTRTGCFTCREDGYKCDEQKPFCGRCVRLRKTCKGYGVRLRWQNQERSQQSTKAPKVKRQRRSSTKSDDTRDTSSSVASSRAGSQVPMAVGSDLEPVQRYLLDHWTTTLATVVSMAATPQNPFLFHLTPMLAHSTALRSAVCSMAARHLAALRNEDSLHILAARNQLLAVSSLRRTIQTEDPQLSLATVLMLQISDRLFTTDSGVNHLTGAKAIITQRRADAWNSPSGTFLLSLCHYQDVIASVARGKKPVLDLDGQIPVEGMASMQELASVLQVVGQISRMHDKDDVQELQLRDIRGRAIEEALVGLDESAEGDAAHTIQAYKHAAFIYLYRVWHDGDAPHPSAANHARSCLDSLGLVPVSSSLASAHVWPLWTAGCESVDDDQRKFVRERIDSMYQARRLPSLRRVMQDIEEVWQIKDKNRNTTGIDNVDCIQAILRTRQREADLA